MFFDLVFLVILIISSYSAGDLIIRIVKIPIPSALVDELALIKVVMGSAICLIICGWMAFLNVEIGQWLLFPIIAIMLIWMLFNSHSFTPPLSIRIRSWVSLDSLCILGLFLFFEILYNFQAFSSRFSARNGSDLVGWTNSTLFFANGNSISDLTRRVLSPFPGVDLSTLFQNPSLPTSPHIYRIPSFTDQINAEFIIGSQRFSLQYFLGVFVHFTPENHQLSWIVAFIIFCAILQFGLIRNILRNLGVSRRKSLFFSFFIAIGLNNLEPLLEGGLGQFLSLSLMLAVFYILEVGKVKFKYFFISITTAALALSYFDGLIFMFVLFSIIYLLKTLVDRKVKGFGAPVVFYVSVCLLLSGPILFKIPNLVQQRISGHRGGWNQGRIPGLSDVNGFYNWLPFDSISLTNWNFISVVINIIYISIVCCCLVASNVPKDTKVIIFSFIVLYIYFMFDVYIRNAELINNYNLYKFGQYAVISNVFLLSAVDLVFFSRIKSKRKVGKKMLSPVNVEQRFLFQKFSLVPKLLIVSFVVSSLNYSYNWTQNRQFTVNSSDSKILNTYYKSYDVFLMGFYGAGYALMTIPGDLRYGVESRGFSVETLRSVPSRKMIFVLPNEACPSDSCQVNLSGESLTLHLLQQLKTISLYSPQ
jgi:hypothetical protein